MVIQREALFSTGRTEYETDPELFAQLTKVLHFNLDVCASQYNHKTAIYINDEMDALAGSSSWALTHPFGDTDRLMAWMNPPYGRGKDSIGPWIVRAAETFTDGGNIVCLLPARTDTRWFQGIVLTAPALLLIKGRLQFYLPCVICSQRTNILYRLEPGAPLGIDLDTPTSVPLCEHHKPTWETRRNRSTAPFPSCLAFFLQPDWFQRIGSLSYHWGHLGKFIRTVPI